MIDEEWEKRKVKSAQILSSIGVNHEDEAIAGNLPVT